MKIQRYQDCHRSAIHRNLSQRLSKIGSHKIINLQWSLQLKKDLLTGSPLNRLKDMVLPYTKEHSVTLSVFDMAGNHLECPINVFVGIILDSSLSVCLFVCPDSIELSGVLTCFYNGDRNLIKILIMVNEYADFEFRIYNFLLFIFIVVVYKLVNRLVRIQNEPRDFIPIVLMHRLRYYRLFTD